jgi:hypothetical protein
MAEQSTTVSKVWHDQQQWSRAANRLKRGIRFWRIIALAFAILGAILATAATQAGLKSGLGQGLSVASAAMLAVAPGIQKTKLSQHAIESWTRVRSASEGLKTEIYLYLTATPPYNTADHDVKLTKKANKIKGAVDDLAGYTLRSPGVDKEMPAVRDIDSYLDKRVQSQIDGYYRKKADENQRRLTLFRNIEFALGLAATLLSAIAAATHVGGFSAWVAVVTTIAAAITSHIAAERYEHLVVSYLATARQLESITEEWLVGDDKSAEAAARLVRGCEDVISSENEGWMAAWNKKQDTKKSLRVAKV